MRNSRERTRRQKQWGQNVLEARKKRGWSQAQLADVAGVTQQTISNVERGLVSPRDDLKMQLAFKLGQPVDTLFSYDRQEAVTS